ncbi:MAG: Hsp20/alpha crystallin family protein [Prolixibacteraceae bacterium]|jgi:HSP20 family molecular chaperone IbpA|nr:Hsp20/alpha crystallin family protein [Prolixibacteraceae bacterium]
MNLVRFHRPAEHYYANQLVNDLFDQLWNTDRIVTNCASKPAVNIYETAKDFRLELLVPGFDKNEIEILVEKDQLIVKSDYKNPDSQEYNYAHVEFVKKSFEKRYKLSEKLNKEAVYAEFKNGILTITLPKLEEENQKLVRKIEIV